MCSDRLHHKYIICLKIQQFKDDASRRIRFARRNRLFGTIPCFKKVWEERVLIFFCMRQIQDNEPVSGLF